MKKIYIFLLVSLFSNLNLTAQDDCECTNCPLGVTDNGSFDAFLDVNVAGDNDLGLCPLQQVCFTINHTWVGDLSVTLTSPGGLSYILMGDVDNGSGGCGTSDDNVDVCLTVGTGNPLTNNTQYMCNGGNPCLQGNWTLPCGGVTDPVSGASQAPNCDLNDFNQFGQPANGTWTLTVNDVCTLDLGTLTDWSMEFACGIGTCVECEAEGGSLNQQDVAGCSGDPALNLNITPSYSGGEVPPSPASDYDYTFLVAENGGISPLSPLDGPDLSSLPPGDYEICGLSYENTQPPFLAFYFGQPVSVLAADLQGDAAPFCGDVSNDCFMVSIGVPSAPIVRDTTGCSNETLILPDGSSCSPGACSYFVDDGSPCPQEVIYTFVPITPTTGSENLTACFGECVMYEGQEYCAPTQVVILENEAGCDSIVVLDITFTNVNAIVIPPDMLSCNNPSVVIDGSPSTGDSFEWRDEDGNLLGTNSMLTVTEVGCYTLTSINTSANPPCTDEATVCVTQDGGGNPTPPAPTGQTPVCVGGNGTYVTPFEAGVTYNWTVSGNGNITAGQGSEQITVNWTAGGTADVCVTAQNTCGTTDPECFTVTINDAPTAPVVAGDTPVCPGETGSYSVVPDPNADGYTWTVPAGASLVSGQGTGSITVTFGAAGGDVCVIANNDCGVSPQACFPVTVLALPAAPTVSGPDDVCPGETVTYSTPDDMNTTTYNWTVPACASIVAGQNTNSITVTWDAGCTVAGDVCVEVANSCGPGSSDCLPVGIGSTVAAPEVTGTETVCVGDTETYTVTANNSVTDYQWTVTGGFINSGNGTNTVSVTWGTAGAGQICNTLVTDCGTSAPDCLDVTINESPTAPVIDGDTPLCVGQTGNYSITSALIGDETFAWTIDGGGNINGSSSAATLAVDWTTAGTYDVCVTLENACGNEQSCFPVTINPATELPTIGGPTSVCQNSTEQYFVTNPLAGETYAWTVPAGATIIDGPTSDMISVEWGSSAGGEICVTASGICGTTAPVCLDVSTDGVPALGTVSGEALVCEGQTITYSVGDLSTATAYTWSADCGNITSGQGTTGITLEITAGCTEINVCVFAETDCGDTSPSCLVVTVNDVPAAATEITGATPTCVSATETYCVMPTANTDSYDWTVTGGTILSGQGTDCVEIEWTTAGTQDLCVSPVNDCGTGDEFCFPVAVSENTAMPEVVTTPEVCDCDETTATVDMTDALDVVWTVPTGATITVGQGTGTVTIDWCDAEGGDVCAELTYDCGTANDCAPVEVFAIPTPDAGADDAICGLTYNLNAVSVFAGSTWSSTDPAVVFTDASTANTEVTVPAFGTYIFTWTETNNDCSNSDEVEITFNASPAIDGTIDEICNATNTAYTISFTVTGGSAPFTVDGVTGTFAGNVFTSAEIPSGDTYNFTVSNGEGCISQTYNGQFTCDCETDAGTIDFTPLEACEDGTVQTTHNGDEVLDGDDISQFILHDGDPINGQIFAANNTGEFGLVAPMMTEVTYFISFAVGDDDGSGNVDLNANCAGFTQGVPVTFYAYPNADAGTDDAICGLTYTLNAVSVFAGSTWSSADPAVVFTDASAANTEVTVPAFGTYIFTWTETNNGCSDSDEVEITFNASPAIDGTIDEICNATNTAYTISFTVTGGSAPFTVDGVAGTFAGNVFTSAEIPSGDTYSFTVSNGEGCISQTYNGQFTCDCETDAGTIDLTPLEACADGSVQAVHNGDEVLDGDDISQFILHDGDPINGQIFAANNTGEFSLVAPMMTGVTYFISFAAGGDDGSGNVDLNAPCANFTEGVPVVFHAYPTPDAGADDAICGLTYTLNAVSVFAGSIWTSADPGVVFTDANDANTDVTVPAFGTYTFIWNEDNAGCAATDAVQITFNDAPTLAAAQTETCDLNTNEYTVEFTITGGAAPYTVNGDALAGTTFVSAPIGSNVPYSFDVFDTNGCGPLTVAGVRNCDCQTDAGTMQQDLQEACIGETVTGLPNGDEVNDGDDAVQYILHDGSSAAAGTIFATGATPEFGLVSPMETGVTYYISTLIGNDNGDGTVDLNDPCLRVAVGTPVVFNPLPSGTISVAAEICEGGTGTVDFNLTGAAPFIVVFAGNTLTNQPAVFSQDVNPAVTTDYTLTEVTDANGCTQMLNESATVVVNIPPSATVATAGLVCNSDDNGNETTLDFADFISAGDTGGTWVDTDNSGATGGFGNLDFTDVTPGDYTFTYTTNSAVAPCTEVSYAIEITVEDCVCPSVATAAPDPLCNDDGSLNLTDLQVTTEAGTWTLIDQPNGANATLTGTNFNAAGLPAGDYTFEFTLTSTPPDGCPTTSQETLTVNTAVNAGTPDAGLIFCENNGNTVVLFDNLNGADNGGTWTEVSAAPSTGNAFNATAGSFNPNGQVPGVYVFRYTVAATAPCADDFSEVTVTITPQPVADAGDGGEISCTEESVTLGGTPVAGLTYAWSATDGGVINPEEIDSPNPTVFVGGTYTLTVTDENTGCQDTDSATVTEALDLPFADFSVSNITCFGDSDGVISLDSVSGGQPPYVYSTDGENYSTTTLFTGLSGGLYTIFVQDANGCTNQVQFDIPEPEELTVEISVTFDDDNIVRFGDSVALSMDFTPTMPFDSLDNVFWTPSEILSCDTCEMTWASPMQSTSFSVTIEEGDCAATDNLDLIVRTDAPIFVPNAFSPDGDGNNDVLYIFAGDQVEKINSFVIYDRWGEAVHQFFEFLPNDPNFGWDGTWNGQPMNPAVFAWGAEVTLIDGRKVVVKGDVTLIR